EPGAEGASVADPLAVDGETESASTAQPHEPPAERPGEPAAPAAAGTVERVVEKRGGFGAALIGGVIAALLGFLAARSEILDPYLPQSLRGEDHAQAIADLRTDIARQGEALEAMRQAAEANPPPDIAPLQTRIDELSKQVAPLPGKFSDLDERTAASQASLAAMETRLSAVEKRPITEGVSKSAIAAYERELEAMRQALADQRSEVEKMIADAREMEAQARELENQAADKARLAAAGASAARLRAALDGGAEYAAILDELKAAGVDVPAALAAHAGDGVATLSALQAAFPPAAREALGAAREASKGSGGIGAFLQRQLGARSVEPRDGQDADAVLSRAQAALTRGDLQAALSEIESLPDPARAALAGWVAQASDRQAAIGAADTLAQSLNTN
ncbi:MAG: hypothetical protein KDK02_17635, partial [Rhodobacteraceae bacterium]|nr:hypothetical protein [Paracoccaceae bacterium]